MKYLFECKGCVVDFNTRKEKNKVILFSKLKRVVGRFLISRSTYSEGTILEELEEILRKIENESSSITSSVLSSSDGLLLASACQPDLDPKVLAAMAAMQQRCGSLAITKLGKKDDLICTFTQSINVGFYTMKVDNRIVWAVIAEVNVNPSVFLAEAEKGLTKIRKVISKK